MSEMSVREIEIERAHMTRRARHVRLSAVRVTRKQISTLAFWLIVALVLVAVSVCGLLAAGSM